MPSAHRYQLCWCTLPAPQVHSERLLTLSGGSAAVSVCLPTSLQYLERQFESESEYVFAVFQYSCRPSITVIYVRYAIMTPGDARGFAVMLFLNLLF